MLTLFKMSDSKLAFNGFNSFVPKDVTEQHTFSEITDTSSLLDNSLVDKVSKKSKNPLLSKPIPISQVDKKLIRKPLECSRYAVWHKSEHYYVPVPCNLWTCPTCSEKKYKILRDRLENSEAKDWAIKRHIILTVAEDSISSNLSELLNDFTKDLRRHGFPRLKYIWVKEFQYERFLKSGVWWRHIHLVVNVDITKYDVIPYWNKQNQNKFNMVEVRKIRNFNSGSYLTKYFTKQEFQDKFDKQERRYGFSAGVLPILARRLSTGEWEFMPLDDARNLYVAYSDSPDLDINWLPDG